MRLHIQTPIHLPKQRGLRVSVGEGWPTRNRSRWNIELAEGATATFGIFDRGKPMAGHLHPMVVRDGKLYVNGVFVDVVSEQIVADGVRLGLSKRSLR